MQTAAVSDIKTSLPTKTEKFKVDIKEETTHENNYISSCSPLPV